MLRDVTIRNFRSCVDCAIPLADYTPLVGYNNGGKSNVLSAIEWLLTGSGLKEPDFYDLSETVVVTGVIEGIDDSLLESLDPNHRKRIEPYCAAGQLRIRRSQTKPSGRQGDVTLFVWDPAHEGEDPWDKNPTGIDGAISALFPAPIVIGAMQDAAEDVAKSKTTTTIGKLLGQITGPLEQVHGATLQAALDDIRTVLTAQGADRAPELQEFDDGANKVIEEFFPGLRIALHLPPPEVKELFKSGTIKVFEGDSADSRDFDALGHGAQRSIQMALIRYLADLKVAKKSGGGRTILLIDEPELYLHPQAIRQVRSALQALAAAEYQVVFSTHSPEMVGVGDVADTLIVRKSAAKGTFPLPTVRAAVQSTYTDAKSQMNTLFELSNSAQVLFADRVILAEGKAEQRLLPALAAAVAGQPFEANRSALVTVGGAGSIAKALRVLTVMGIPAKAVVDLDYGFKDGVKAGFIDREDDEHKTCRAVLAELAAAHPIELSEDGLPMKRGGMTSEEAFALMATKDSAQPSIRSLHQRLRQHNIWMWTRGAFEDHLGITGKNEDTWGEFAQLLADGDIDTILADVDGIRELLDWLTA